MLYYVGPGPCISEVYLYCNAQYPNGGPIPTAAYQVHHLHHRPPILRMFMSDVMELSAFGTSTGTVWVLLVLFFVFL